MYRFASLYVIGQMLNRTPVYIYNDNYLRQIESEMFSTFPNYFKKIYFLKENFNDFQTYKLSWMCCDYTNPKILLEKNISSRGLMLTMGIHFENYKYFHHKRELILKLFSFGSEVKKIAISTYKKIINNDTSHKICVHTRFGDFVGLGESLNYQVEAALEIIRQNLTKNYLKSLNVINSEVYNKIYYFSDINMKRGSELYFAQKYCDTLLITAFLSSYSFWMGYLMPKNKQIFYIRKHVYILGYHIDGKEALPEEWIPIEEPWLFDHLIKQY
ncbi:hypothetical protein Mgra_00000075 [Meloidogyne graminicola]|uniref:L-Fucosyltransferase n=1 Tax=Meloidogyne graminicola TaxID=189291 RepID=A0A8T0A4L2_9BILA|nr:hypothetical protein Mgra_00000075 [Meloidogyne graminicola]